MTGAKHFGDLTHWQEWDPRTGTEGWSEPGWALPADPSRYISRHDPYWDRVLVAARHTYGDPNIHYNTDSVGKDRHLVFGDDTDLPRDGTVVYHDAATKRNWVQNDDGTVSLVGPDGHTAAPFAPVGYRKVGEGYAPVDERGAQVAPLLGGVPSSDNGFYTDPHTGVLTPKNANGDYFTLGPDGRTSFFDKTGAPISEEQFRDAATPRDPAQPPEQPGPGTDEQQSGKAADAVRKLHEELKDRYSTISDAEEKLSEVLLSAHATTTAGQRELNDIQQKIVEAVDNPAMGLDTAAGERSFLAFLRGQVGRVNDLLASGSLRAEDQSKTAQALAALYAADDGAETGGTPAAPPPQADPPGSADPVAVDPGVVDPGLGPAPAMPDPNLSDLLGAAPLGMPAGGDPLSSLASLLPGGLGGLGGAGASPLDGLGGLLGAASPLTGLGSQLGDRDSHERPSEDTTDKAADDATDQAHTAKADDAAADTPGAPPAGQPDPQHPDPAGGDPPPPVAPAAAGALTVTLPDGSVAAARSPQAAQAIRDYLAGATVDAAYRQNGIALPALGTPVTNPVDPSRLSCGDLAMFTDHFVPVLSSVKALVDGQVVPLASVSSSPNFLGWFDPAATNASAAPPAAAPAAPAPGAATDPAVPAPAG